MQGARAVFFPEMSFTGFSTNTSATKECDAQTVSRMKALARKYQLSIGFGWVKDCTAVCGKCENHYTIVDREGSVCSDYAKLHPFPILVRMRSFRAAALFPILRWTVFCAAA